MRLTRFASEVPEERRLSARGIEVGHNLFTSARNIPARWAQT